MIHLRIVAPKDRAAKVLETLDGNRSVCNVVHLPGVVSDPDGDLVLADVAREDASVVLADLKHLGLEQHGSISLAPIDTYLSDRADDAVAYAKGAPTDAVVWEEVEAHTEEQTELSLSFVAFMALAAVLAAVAIFEDSSVLLVGAMVVGPEFGPIAGFSVALATRRADVARSSARALLVGFPVAIVIVVALTLLFRALGLVPETYESEQSSLSSVIANPNVFSFVAAVVAGAAGVLSLSTAKSGALIGVLVSVTTIPSAANLGITLAYGDGAGIGGSTAQLAVNLVGIFLAGTVTLVAQRAEYARRRRRHLRAKTP